MKIKTKLSINLYLFVCTIFVVTMALYWTYQEHKKADENERLVVEIQKSIFERTILRDEYMQYQEERAKIQWQKQTEYIGKSMDLASQRFKDDMSKAILDEMRRDYESTVTLFSKIVENKERKHLNEEEKVLSREHENKLFSQMLLKSYALSDAAQRLIESNRRKSEKELKRAHLLTFILVVALMITTLTNSVLLSRLLRKRLETIQKGTRVIGGGNLDYRIDLRSKDEFEDFSNEFNTMSDKLKKSFVSIESLEKEITERKRAEEALQESRERYRTLFENVPIGLYRTTGDGQIIDANPALVEMLGYPDHASLLTINAADTYVDPEARTERQNILKDKRFLKDYDMRLRRLDGSVLWVEDNVRVIYHADGRILYYEGSLRDITERKKMEEILKVSTRQWQTTFEGINDAVCLLDMEGKILQCNKAMATLLGKSFSEIIGSICCKLVHGTSGPIEGCPRIRMRETRSRENLVLSLEDRWFNVSSDPILDETDHLIGTVHIISDITERKRAEDEREKLIQELQKALAEVKTLSGLIPICASCKKIRDDKGYWNQIESYIRDHSEAEFSHGICPDCMKKLYPDEI
jgi:PAS domain S-box-containing protein